MTDRNKFWQFVYEMMSYGDFQLLHLNEYQMEAWLKRSKGKDATLIRVAYQPLSETLSEDLKQVFQQGERIRQQYHLKKVSLLNVYTNMLAISCQEMHNNHMVMHTFTLNENDEHGVESFIKEAMLKETIKETLVGIDMHPMLARRQVFVEYERQQEIMRKVFEYGKPIVTYLLLFMNIAVFLWLEYQGSSKSAVTLYEWGAKYNPAIVNGQWWRLFTSMFLHIGWLHLFTNMLALYYLGTVVEKIYGSTRFIIIYGLSGLFGSIASFALNTQMGAGASGAIFGCLGALMYFGLYYRSFFFQTMGTNVIFIILLNLGIGFILPMVDNSAHIGGLIGGFLTASIVHLPQLKRHVNQLWLALAVYIVFSCGMLAYGTMIRTQQIDPLTNAQIAQEYIAKKEFQKAYPFLIQAVQADPNTDADVYFLLGVTEAQLHKFADAKDHFEKTIELKRSFHEAHYNLALVLWELNEKEDARKEAKEALRLSPNTAKYKQLVLDMSQSKSTNPR